MIDEPLKKHKIKGHKDVRHPDYIQWERMIKHLKELDRLIQLVRRRSKFLANNVKGINIARIVRMRRESMG